MQTQLSATLEDSRAELSETWSGARAGGGELAPLSLQAAHLEDLCSCPELVSLISVVQEVNGLAHVIPGILDLKSAH